MLITMHSKKKKNACSFNGPRWKGFLPLRKDTGVEALCSRSLIHHLTRLRVAEVGREGPFLVGTAPTKTPLSEVCPRAFQ